MKIAIVSDSHDNIANIEKAFKYFESQGITSVIHAGDLSAPTMFSNVIAPNYHGKVYLIYGNIADRDLMPKFFKDSDQAIFLGDSGKIEVDGKKIFLMHKPDILEEVVAKNEFDVIVYGHTHESKLEERGNQLVINPGTLGGIFASATFAIYDTDSNKIEIKKLEEI